MCETNRACPKRMCPTIVSQFHRRYLYAQENHIEKKWKTREEKKTFQTKIQIRFITGNPIKIVYNNK